MPLPAGVPPSFSGHVSFSVVLGFQRGVPGASVSPGGWGVPKLTALCSYFRAAFPLCPTWIVSAVVPLDSQCFLLKCLTCREPQPLYFKAQTVQCFPWMMGLVFFTLPCFYLAF